MQNYIILNSLTHTIEEGWLVAESQVTKRVWSSSRSLRCGTDFWWNAWGLWIQTNWSYHVWLRGSQFSLPTFSMQNFWGPLLPIWVNNKDTVYEINTSVLVVKYPATIFNIIIFIYPSDRQSHLQAGDRSLWQTAAVSSSSHYPSPSQTVKTSFCVKHT